MPGVHSLLMIVGALAGALIGASMGGHYAYNRIIFMGVGGLMVGLSIAAAIELAAEKRRR